MEKDCWVDGQALLLTSGLKVVLEDCHCQFHKPLVQADRVLTLSGHFVCAWGWWMSPTSAASSCICVHLCISAAISCHQACKHTTWLRAPGCCPVIKAQGWSRLLRDRMRLRTCVIKPTAQSYVMPHCSMRETMCSVCARTQISCVSWSYQTKFAKCGCSKQLHPSQL